MFKPSEFQQQHILDSQNFKHRFIEKVFVNSVGIFCNPLHELNLSRCNSEYVFVSNVHISLISDKAGKQTHHIFS